MMFRVVNFNEKRAYIVPILYLCALPNIKIFKILILNLEDEKTKPYVEVVRGKGFSPSYILRVYLLRNIFIHMFYHSKSIFLFTKSIFLFMLSILLGLIYILLLLAANFLYTVYRDALPDAPQLLYSDKGELIAKSPYSPLLYAPFGTDRFGEPILYKIIKVAKFTILIALFITCLRLIFSSLIAIFLVFMGGSCWHILKKHIRVMFWDRLLLLFMQHIVQTLILLSHLGLLNLFIGGVQMKEMDLRNLKPVSLSNE
jgi:ABC-type dipeptide/oligopeptide/nickel transport system permease subunit